MTRMWCVPPDKMCQQHLLGEHKELHQLVGHIENGNLATVKGHADKNQIDTTRIQERHEELVEEMRSRGLNHNSPLNYSDELGLGKVYGLDNFQELLERCDNCRHRHEHDKEQEDEDMSVSDEASGYEKQGHKHFMRNPHRRKAERQPNL